MGCGLGSTRGLIGRLNQRHALLAFLIGVAPVLVAITQLRNRPAFAKLILWPAVLIGSLVPGHNIGTVDKPVYEGTPVNLLAGIIGIVLSAILYSAIVYVLLAWIQRERTRREDLERVGA
jgi:prepilin signal peptidase PulO-like enzyme (type II secretory pathway)